MFQMVQWECPNHLQSNQEMMMYNHRCNQSDREDSTALSLVEVEKLRSMLLLKYQQETKGLEQEKKQ